MTRIFASLLALCFVVACDSGNPTSPSQTVQFTVTDLQEGTGATAANGQTVSVAYTGWLYSETAPDNKGTQFDSRTAAQPFSFVLGAGQVIRGWDQGIVGMRVGGLRRLVIPPELAYGAAGSGPIPPNAALVFDVELLAIQ